MIIAFTRRCGQVCGRAFVLLESSDEECLDGVVCPVGIADARDVDMRERLVGPPVGIEVDAAYVLRMFGGTSDLNYYESVETTLDDLATHLERHLEVDLLLSLAWDVGRPPA